MERGQGRSFPLIAISKKGWRRVLDGFELPALLLDHRNVVLVANRALGDILKESPERLEKRPWSEIKDRLLRVMEPDRCERAFRQAERGCYLKLVFLPLTDDDEEDEDEICYCLIEQVIDVLLGERRKALVARAGEAILVTDEHGRLSFMNREAERLTGWSWREARGRTLREILPLRDARGRELREADLGDRSYTLTDREGRSREVEVSSIRVEQEGLLRGMIQIIRDVSEKRRRDRSLHQRGKIEALELLNRTLAHDFRNLLTVVEGHLELAMNAGDDERRREALVRARQALDKALEFSEGLLSTEQALHRYDPARLVRETLDFLLANTGLRCRVKVPDDLWLPEVDRVQLTQILVNLVLNARQALGDGGEIVVEAENVSLAAPHPPLAPGDYVRLAVRDNGPGIPPEKLSRIFEPYYSEKEGGQGLGLALVYSIVTAHGGHIEVDSAPGQGTVFTIYLPARGPAVQAGKESGHRAPGKKRVLVVEDNQGVLDILTEMLTLLGAEVVAARTPEEALELFRQAGKEAPFDLVILDQNLPGQTGLELFRRLRELAPGLRAVLTTGFRDERLRETFLREGGASMLLKPFTLKDLEQLLKP